MKYFINYSHNGYKNSQLYAIKKANEFGFHSIPYTEKDLDCDFNKKNRKILERKRGAGYWVWKPYIILDMLSKIEFGDNLVYMDSGANLCRNVDGILDMIDSRGILTFRLCDYHTLSRWTIGDCFYVINPLGREDDFKSNNMILASFIFMTKTQYLIDFMKKWLYYCEQEFLLIDSHNCIYKNNFPDYIEHRWDQSILSLLCYNNNIMHIPDISQYGTELGVHPDWIHIEHHRTNN